MKKSFEIIQTNFGNFLINEYDLIGNFLKNYQFWEIHLYEFYSQILNENSYCIDAGANLGFHTIQFGKLSKKVYAFEPQPLVFNQMCANILFNDLNEIIVPYRLALGDKYDKQQLWNIEHEDWVGNEVYNWGGRGIIPKGYGGKRSTDNEVRDYDIVDVVTLDSFDFPKCDLIKIDIQGYEYFAFLGAQKLIKTHKPIILVENPLEENDIDIKSKLFLKEIGYEFYRFNIGNNDDCVALHPKSENYIQAKKVLDSISVKYNITISQ